MPGDLLVPRQRRRTEIEFRPYLVIEVMKRIDTAHQGRTVALP